MAYAVSRAFWGALKTEENKVGRARQMAIAKQQLYRRLYKSAREQYAPQIEMEKRRAKAEFEKKLRVRKRQIRKLALQMFHSQLQAERKQLIAKLTVQEKQAVKAAPFNIRRLIAQQYRQQRMRALEEFSLRAKEAFKEFNLKLESQLEEWEKSQRQQFQKSIQKWERQTWKEIENKIERQIEQQLKASLNQALKSVPEGAEIKELKFEEGAWKITYASETQQVSKQPSTYSSDELLKRLMPTLPPVIGGKLVFEASKGSKEAATILKRFEKRQVVRAKAILSGFTPFYPSPTSVAIESALTWSTEPFKEFALDPEYAILSASSEILGFITLGEALSWAGGKIGGWIRQTETYQKLARTIKFCRVYRFYYEHFKVPAKAFYQTRIKLPAEKLLYKHILRRTPKGLAPQVVDIPEFVKPTAMDLWKQEAAWQIAESPKTSALLLTKYYRPTSKHVSAWVSEHWLKKATGGISYATVKPQLERFIPIQERKLPYIPTLELKTSKITSRSIITSSVIFSAFRLPFKTKIESKPVIRQVGKISVKITPKISTKTLTQSLEISTPTLKLKTKLSNIQTFKSEKTIEIPPLSLPESEFKLPKPKRRKRKRPIGFYGWIGLEVPVPSARQILKFVLEGGRKK